MLGPLTTPSIGPPTVAWSTIFAYTATPGNLAYSGWARSAQPTFAFAVTSVSADAAAVVTITAHGLSTDNTVVI